LSHVEEKWWVQSDLKGSGARGRGGDFGWRKSCLRLPKVHERFRQKCFAEGRMKREKPGGIKVGSKNGVKKDRLHTAATGRKGRGKGGGGKEKGTFPLGGETKSIGAIGRRRKSGFSGGRNTVILESWE